MKQRHLNSPAVRIVAALALAIIATVGVRSYLQHQAEMSRVRKVALDQEKVGLMSQVEYFRWRNINSGVLAKNNLSDEDFDWCLMMMSQTKPHPVANAVKNARIVNGIFMKMVANEDVTPERKEQLYKAVTPLLRGSRKLERLVALNLLGALKERRAIPNILPLLNDPDPSLRPVARKTLDEMGYR